MGELILNVLPYGLAAAAAAPIVAVVTALILAHSKRPLLSASVFTAGAAALDVVFAVALLVAANASGAFDGGSSEAVRSSISFSAQSSSRSGSRPCSPARAPRSKRRSAGASSAPPPAAFVAC